MSRQAEFGLLPPTGATVWTAGVVLMLLGPVVAVAMAAPSRVVRACFFAGIAVMVVGALMMTEVVSSWIERL